MYTMKRDTNRVLPDLALPIFRDVQVGFRLTKDDAALLHELADGAGVGHTTLARLIVEKYLADQRGKAGR